MPLKRPARKVAMVQGMYVGPPNKKRSIDPIIPTQTPTKARLLNPLP